MNRKHILDRILTEKLVVIIRMKLQHQVGPVVDALVKGGIKVLEITSNTPGYLNEIKAAKEKHPEVLIGAGTVTTVAIAEEAIASGAQFLVSPNTAVELVKIAHNSDIPILMGAMTPTEISTAANAGADVVKLFPADLMGIDYFKAVRAPLDSVQFFAVGGIAIEDVQHWLEAGASGLGIGGKLTKVVENEEDFEAIVTASKKIRALLRP